MTPGLEIFLLVSAAAATSSLLRRWAVRRPANPREQERRRRQWLLEHGRLATALITDFREGTIYYSYSINGVVYEAAQVIEDFAPGFPGNPESWMGPATTRYDAKNPANSMIASESWHGFHLPRMQASQTGCSHMPPLTQTP